MRVLSVVLTSLTLLLIACGDSRSQTASSTPTTTVACPMPDASAELGAGLTELTGAFSEECVRMFSGEDPVIPDLSPRFQRQGFGLTPDQRSHIRVYYKSTIGSIGGMILEIYPRSVKLSDGNPRVTTPAGNVIRMGVADSVGFEGSFTFRGAYYSLIIPDATDNDESRSAIVSVADAVLGAPSGVQ